MFNFAKTLAHLSLLGAVSQSLAQNGPQGQQGGPPPPLPADAQRLPKDCQEILLAAGVSAAFKASRANTDDYFVPLKLSATVRDIDALLSLPALRGVQAKQRYTAEYDVGFSAKLTYEQVCALDKDARVGVVVVCEGDICSAQKAQGNPTPGPSLNSGIRGAPDITGLDQTCARVVWYTILEFDPAETDPGKYVALTKIWVSQKDADAFFLTQPGIMRNPEAEADGYYAGKWSYKQLCDIEKNPLVSRVDTMEAPPPPGSQGGQGRPPQGKGGKGF